MWSSQRGTGVPPRDFACGSPRDMGEDARDTSNPWAPNIFPRMGFRRWSMPLSFALHMPPALASFGLRSRLLMTRLMTRIGLREHYILLPMAFLVGVVTSAAAVAFHTLI